MLYYYGSTISPNKIETAEGFLICKNVPIARIGPQKYLARELGLDGDPDRVIEVNRYEEDVFDPATIASFEGKPVTDGHPAENVSPETFSGLARGHAQNVRREGDNIVADLHINDAALISEVQNGIKREVSCGYLCDYVADGEGYKQTKIRGNHVAVVTNGRAGHDVAIKDAVADAMEKGNPMSKMLKEVLKAFGSAAKDANPEQLDELAETTAEAIETQKDEAPEGEPAAKAQEPAPAEEPKEEEVKDEDQSGLEAKIDKLIEMIGSLVSKATTPDEKPKELSEEEQIDEAINELEETKDAEEEGSEAKTIEAEGEDGCGSKDSAVAVLKAMRPVVAAIKDKSERKIVTDALLAAFGTKRDMSDIMNASEKSAKVAADASAKTHYEKTCEDQSNAYASRNPHLKEVK